MLDFAGGKREDVGQHTDAANVCVPTSTEVPVSVLPASQNTTSSSRLFLSKVQQRSPEECWLWTAAVTGNGYGHFAVGPRIGRRFIRAHRFAWKLFRGEIPNGLHVLHRCDNRLCCNPSHLFLGTNVDNVADKVAKNRQARVSNPRDAKGWFIPRSEVIR